jgi:LacI family transcriptional regulator
MENNRSERNVTLQDVARHAGVSVSTASRALNEHPTVRTETRERVVAAAKALNYKPASRRRAQISAQSDSPFASLKAVAMVASGINNPYYDNLVLGIEDEADHENINLILMTTRDDPLYQRRVIERLTATPLEGAILLNACLSVDAILDIQAKRELPMVVFHYAVEHLRVACINTETQAAGHRAATYLISLGHKRIAYLGRRNLTSAERQRGAEQALREAGAQVDPLLVFCRDLSEQNAGMRAMEEVFASGSLPTGVIAFNDLMAYGAMHAIYDRGLRIPDDISVIGFDNVPSSEHVTPPLTTVALPTYQMGQSAMRLLRRIQAGENMREAEGITLSTPLVVRGSTGPCKEGKRI